jgi:FkbM family methyltransferase
VNLIRQISDSFYLLSLPIFERRKRVKRRRKGFFYKVFYESLCKVNLYDSNIVFDKVLNLKYQLETDIGNKLYYQGTFEHEDIFFLQSLIKDLSEPVVLDIGANIGFHSVMLQKANKSLRIYAFEPSEGTRKILNYNILCNGIKNANIMSQAVSNEVGTATFYEAADNAYSSLKDTKRKPINSGAMVDVVTIDVFAEAVKLSRLDLIKIDVEGFESEVIEGGLKTLTEFRPNLFVEIYQGKNSNPDPMRTINSLVGLGYKPFVFVQGKLVPFQGHHDKHYNYYFTFRA